MADNVVGDKQTEERIAQDNLLLWSVLESLDHPFMVIDAEDYSILFANSAARSSVSSDVNTCYALSHHRNTPCDGSDHICPLAEVKRTGNPLKVVHRHFDQQGNLRWVEVNAHPILDESKQVVRVIEYCLDITERKRAEDELRESEERYRNLFANNHAVMLIIDPETANIVDVNPAACSFYGYTREQLITKKITDINTLSEDQVFLEMQRAKAEERKHFYFQHRLADGAIRDVEVYSGPIALRGRHLLYSIIHDISARKRAEKQAQRAHAELEQRVEERTAELVQANERLRQEIEERKRIEQALRNSEKKYRALINEASDAIVLSDTEGNVLDTNKKALELFGCSKDQLLQKHVTELHPKEVLERTLTAFKEAVQSGVGSLNDTKILRKDGKTVPVDITGSVIHYGDQKVVQGFFRDITERKLAEDAIRQAEEQYRLLVQNLPSVVYKGYKDWSVDFFDKKKIESLLGYKLEDFISRKIKWSEVILEDDLEHARRQFVQAMKGDRSYVREYRIKTKAGDILWIQDRGQIVCDETGEIEYLSGVFFDITDHKQKDEALRKSEKELRFLSAELLNTQEKERARFARELHDGIGQVLSTMKVRIETFATIARSDLNRLRVEELENLVPIIRQTIEEVRNTCMDLRPSTLDSLGILPTIDWFCREHQTTYPFVQIEKKIDIQETEVPDPLRIVIYRIFQEALNNAARHSGADVMQISLAKKDGEIRLAVQDNGQGFNLEEFLSADTPKRSFGLTSMKERAELSGGSFSIESGVGQGTTIRATWKV